jgi:hypothetical protein
LVASAGAAPFLSGAASFEAADAEADLATEQHLSAEAQHLEAPPFMVEQEPSLPPQQPFWPSLLLQLMPAAEHLQPSLVPPVVSVASAFASIMFGSAFAVVVAGGAALLLAVAAGAFELLVVVVVSVVPHPAKPMTMNDNKATSFSFIKVLQCFLKLLKVKRNLL